MRPASAHCAVAFALIWANSARADKYALSIDAGAGAAAHSVAAPFTTSSPREWGSGFTFWLGSRYAVTNGLEVSASGFFEPSAPYYHSGAVVETDNGRFSGTLAHRYQRFGAVAGARVLLGSVVRLVAGLELGWCRRSFSDFHHYDVSDPAEPQDYQLGLPDFTTDNLLLVPTLGVEWAFADHLSVALLPRLHWLVGPEPTLALTGTLTFSYAWYL